MKGFEEIDAIELQYCGPNGRPTLGKAFDMLVDRWNAGHHDREIALRLLFLGWLSWMGDPNTGLATRPPADFFKELFDSLGGEDAEDQELWFVVGVMTNVWAGAFGGLESENHWEEIGERFRHSLGNRVNHMDVGMFEGRGYYGHYFAHQARGHTEHWLKESPPSSRH